MAIVQSLAIGNARKSAGNLTFQTIHGRTIAREKPLYVTNPNTPAQQATRSIMRNLVEAWRGYGFQLRPYFTVKPQYGSSYNQFIKMNHSLGSSSWYVLTAGGIVAPYLSWVSNGKYGSTAVSKGFNETTHVFKFSVNDAQLKSELIEGDMVIFVGNPMDGVNPKPTKIVTHELTASQVTTLKTGGEITVPTGDTFVYNDMAAIYYSPARNVSSSAQIEAL